MFSLGHRIVRKKIKANGKAHSKREITVPVSCAHICMPSPILYLSYKLFENLFFFYSEFIQ